jgi:glutamate-ammonia-ligase adenylyltransferase
MRALMTKERPPHGPWDLKLLPGGLVDIEFAAQTLQIIHAADDGPLRANTGQALLALRHAGLADAEALVTLAQAWRLQQNLTQVLKLALDDPADPTAEPERFQALLAKAGGEPSFEALAARLTSRQAKAHNAFLAIVEHANHL